MGDEKLPDAPPNKRLGKFSEFFSHIWNEIEPVVTEFCSYILIIFLVYFVTWITESFVPEKIKDILNYIKYFLIIAVVGLLTVRTIILVSIRSIGSLAKEGKKVFSTEDSKVLENIEELKVEVSKLELEEKSIQEAFKNATLGSENRATEKQPLRKIRRSRKK